MSILFFNGKGNWIFVVFQRKFPELRYGHVLVEEVFRGILMPELVDISDIAFQPDFQLIHKRDENHICRFQDIVKFADAPLRILPRTLPCPPVMKEFICQNAHPSDSEEKLNLKVVVRSTYRNLYRLAEEHEKPTVDFTKNGSDLSNPLYSNIKLRN